MKFTIFTFSIISLLIGSCATLNINETNDLAKEPFDSLMLRPNRETNNLRIDVLRQTYSVTVNDSTTESRETPFNPIGFDLGNGLFYDLNKNISFRLDYLLGISSEEDFKIQEINRPAKNKKIVLYTFKNDTLSLSYPPKEKAYYHHHRTLSADSISYFNKNRMMYALVENDSSVNYYNRKRKWDVIYKLDKDHYFVGKRGKDEMHQISGNSIVLGNDYIVCMTNNNTTIEIKRQRKREREPHVIYTIERYSNKIFIYFKSKIKPYGKKIELDNNNVSLYIKRKVFKKYELID